MHIGAPQRTEVQCAPPPRIILSLITVLSLGLIPLQTTAAEAQAGDREVQALIAKAFTGKLSRADKDTLIHQYPEVAAVVPDYDATTSQEVVATSSRTPGVSIAATACSTYSGWSTLKSTLGLTLYRFYHSAKVCSNGSVVTSHSSPTYEMSQQDPTITSWKIVDRYVTGVSTAQSKSRLQVRVSHCIFNYGCYASSYPTGTIIATRVNTATISTTFG